MMLNMSIHHDQLLYGSNSMAEPDLFDGIITTFGSPPTPPPPTLENIARSVLHELRMAQDAELMNMEIDWDNPEEDALYLMLCDIAIGTHDGYDAAKRLDDGYVYSPSEDTVEFLSCLMHRTRYMLWKAKEAYAIEHPTPDVK